MRASGRFKRAIGIFGLVISFFLSSCSSSDTAFDSDSSVSPSSESTNPFKDVPAEAAAEKAAAEKEEARKAAAEKAVQDASTPKICIPNSDCPIGSKGPGGGIVFYDAGSQQSWGRYLEVATLEWAGTELDPRVIWCDRWEYLTELVKKESLSRTLGDEVGKGKANTDLMLAFCSSGAGVLARNYKGGGKSDWHLPSRIELEEIYKYRALRLTQTSSHIFYFESGIGETDTYWSSSEISASRAAVRDLYSGREPRFGSKEAKYKVRPVRAF
jgi:hypothetical protein